MKKIKEMNKKEIKINKEDKGSKIKTKRKNKDK